MGKKGEGGWMERGTKRERALANGMSIKRVDFSNKIC
jgi:hypothetical protein